MPRPVRATRSRHAEGPGTLLAHRALVTEPSEATDPTEANRTFSGEPDRQPRSPPTSPGFFVGVSPPPLPLSGRLPEDVDGGFCGLDCFGVLLRGV